jgi:signal transduction histidine kinase
VSLVCAVGYQVAAFPGGPGPLPVVAALYFLAARGHRLRSLGLGLLAALTVVGARLLGMGGLESPLIVAFPTAVVAAVFLGQLVAARRSSRAAAARALAEARLQSELEAQGRVVAERLRIARELHDVVAHNISLIHVQATMGVHVMASRPDEAEAALVAIKAASKQALRELRGVLGVLRQVDDDDTRPAPGLTDLDALVSTTSRAGLDVRVHVVGSPVDLTPSVDVTAYRIVQESLTNALRYAPGASTVVTLEYGGRDLTVDVSDDGNPSAGLTPAAGGSGQGITGMRERARALGGTLSATRSPAGGFTVHAQLPLAGGA